uniref:Tick transposon n=1 Tax=Rhipicephalus zambeziensis TaxID=60191 RepID=A0A224Z5Y8_9ACAR
MKNVKQFVPCARGVVYRILLSCGKAYIGQTGRCLDVRLREHPSSLTGRPFTHLALHCKGCKKGSCKPPFEQTTVMQRHNGSTQREIIEAFLIGRERNCFISYLSINLQEGEIVFLERHGRLSC